jgi:hypothetical protein
MQGNSLVRIQPDCVARKLYFGRAESTINLGHKVRYFLAGSDQDKLRSVRLEVGIAHRCDMVNQWPLAISAPDVRMIIYVNGFIPRRTGWCPPLNDRLSRILVFLLPETVLLHIDKL